MGGAEEVGGVDSSKAAKTSSLAFLVEPVSPDLVT